jgi:tRNA1Val (adenine37-N6)-methyltransferase
MTSAPERSLDAMFQGKLLLEQHRRGYRFSVDAVLLAHWTSRLVPNDTLEVGMGSGVVSLLLAWLWEHHRKARPSMLGVEVQDALATLATDNVIRNTREEQCTVVCGDIRAIAAEHRRQWRVSVCNPPYFQVDAGHVSPNQERAAARHECNGSLEELLRAMALCLHTRGHVMLVYPAEGLPRMMRLMQRVQLHVTRLQWVHPTWDAPASLVLVQARLRSTPLVVERPWILYEPHTNREMTPETEALFAGEEYPPFSSP